MTAVVTTYTVRRGDSLSAIAQHHGTTVRALRAANRGVERGGFIHPGTVLSIPQRNVTSAIARNPADGLRVPTPKRRPRQPTSQPTSDGVAQPTAATRSAGPGRPISAARIAEYHRLGTEVQQRYPNPQPDTVPIRAYARIIEMVAEDTGVSQGRIRGLIEAESERRWNAVNRSGARGLMQLKDVAWVDVQRARPELGDVSYRTHWDNPAFSALFGATYFVMSGSTSQGYMRTNDSGQYRTHERRMRRSST